jgi:hypothetical protein
LVKLGDRSLLQHPRFKKKEIVEAVNILGPSIELKAVTGDYLNDFGRTFSALEGDCATGASRKAKSASCANLPPVPASATSPAIRNTVVWTPRVHNLLVEATTPSLDTVHYEITKPGRDVLAEHMP